MVWPGAATDAHSNTPLREAESITGVGFVIDRHPSGLVEPPLQPARGHPARALSVAKRDERGEVERAAGAVDLGSPRVESRPTPLGQPHLLWPLRRQLSSPAETCALRPPRASEGRSSTMTVVAGQVLRGRFVPGSRVEPRSGALLGGLVVVVAALVVLGGSAARPAPSLSVGNPVAVPAAAAPGRGLELLPRSAQAVVSATLGAESWAFVARRSGGGYRLGGGGVAADLERARGLVAGGRGVARDDGCGVGRGGRLEPARRGLGRREREPCLARPGRADGVVRGGAVRDRAGVHALPPPGRQAGPVTLALRLGGGVRAHRSASGTVLLTRPGRPGLSYGALSASDANGRPLRAALAAPRRQAPDPGLGPRRALSARDRPADPAGRQAHRQRRDRRRQVRLQRGAVG